MEAPFSSRQEHLDLSRRILVSGTEHIVSYPGTGQYNSRGAGTAACGLASVNFARVLFAREQEIQGDPARLLKTALAKETLEEITNICSSWSSNAHLEVEEIVDIPIFDKTLKLHSTKYGLPSLGQFRTLLSDLSQIPTSAAVIITRPPEIIACLNLRLSKSASVFIVFDSHPRPNIYPDGAGVICNTSIEATAHRLTEILPVIDLPRGELQWQAQLLANYSGHVFVPRPSAPTPAHLVQVVLDSSLQILTLRSEVASLAAQNTSLATETKRLEGQLEAVERKWNLERRDWARAERSRRDGQHTITPSLPGPSEHMRHTTVGRVLSDPRIPLDHDHWRSRERALPPNTPSGLSGDSRGFKPAVLQQDFEEESRRLRMYIEDLRRSAHGTPTSLEAATEASTHSKTAARMPHDNDIEDDFRQALQQQREFDEENRSLRMQLEGLREGGSVSPKAPAEPLCDIDDGFQQALLQQQEFDEESRRLRAQLEHLRRTAIQRTFECGICFDEHPEDDVAPIEGCSHTFCRECMRDYVGSMLSQHRFPILCPTCSADRGAERPGAVGQNILQVLNFTEDQHKTWTELSLIEFSVLLHCQRCTRSAWVDRTDMNEIKILACPMRDCNHVWCKACQQTIEEGGPPHSCDGSSELDHLMRQRGWKYCPTCRTPIQKESGCNHMTCGSPACNTHFCYVCGENIVQSALQNEIRNAVSAHYRRCNLFGDVPDVGVPP
ncbi:hypothetical protein OF83DRAFT_1120887 [Amylostereum chailletii]|nr:hypothetical protein OF83DRAFT_1120887 [Amylostereum chailletii]